MKEHLRGWKTFQRERVPGDREKLWFRVRAEGRGCYHDHKLLHILHRENGLCGFGLIVASFCERSISFSFGHAALLCVILSTVFHWDVVWGKCPEIFCNDIFSKMCIVCFLGFMQVGTTALSFIKLSRVRRRPYLEIVHSTHTGNGHKHLTKQCIILPWH